MKFNELAVKLYQYFKRFLVRAADDAQYNSVPLRSSFTVRVNYRHVGRSKPLLYDSESCV